jgi:hypothetical protein
MAGPISEPAMGEGGAGESPNPGAQNDGRPVPGRPMPQPMQYALGAYVVGMFFLLLYLLVKTWPLNLKGVESTQFLWGTVQLPPEIRLMFVAAVAGALGSYVHLATSFADYAGNEKLTVNWGWWYVVRPFVGMALAEVVYFALRGGLLNSAAGDSATSAISPYGVATTAALTGLFSKQATDKLREVFETLFRTQEKVERKDALPETTTAPAAAKADRATAGTSRL